MKEQVVELRRKNQLTWPLAEEMGLHEGVRLVITYDPATQEARVRPIRDSYAGVLAGVFGDGDDAAREHVERERATWT